MWLFVVRGGFSRQITRLDGLPPPLAFGTDSCLLAGESDALSSQKGVSMSVALNTRRTTAATRLLIVAVVALGVLFPRPASAQPADSWKGTVAPFYFWASRTNGDVATRAGTVPVFMTFEDAADRLAGAFSVHFEAQKKRLGIFADVNFIKLSTDADFTLQGPVGTIVHGDVDLDNTFFEAGASYLINDTPTRNFAVIGGLRTFSLSNTVDFTTPNVTVTAIDAGRTAVSVFGGFTYRPALSEKLNFLSRADIGGGSGMSWSALLGFEFRPKPWAGLIVGYKGLGVNFGKEEDDEDIRNVDLTYYGPIFGLNLHWGGR
jgi:hypothetical protein